MDLLPKTQSSKALSVPELLHEIFLYMDKASNASNARVCRQWMNVALDILWRGVDNIIFLFKVLAPLELMADQSYSFTRALEPNDWRNFDRYRSRVKTLSYSAHPDALVHSSAFAQVAMSRPNLIVLPELHSLKWNASELMPCCMFMHDGLQSFSIRMSSDGQDVGAFFRQSAVSMAGITTLNLCVASQFGIIEEDVAQLLPQLQNLKKLLLYPIYFTTKIAEAAATIPGLEYIKLGFYPPQTMLHLRVTNLAPQFRRDAYPSLSRLSMNVPFRDPATFIATLASPTNLTQIHLQSPIAESAHDIHNLSVVIGNNCPRLKRLDLLPSLENDQTETGTNTVHQPIPIDALQSICRCADLAVLTIAHHKPLPLQLDDVSNIAVSLPNIQHLVLNNEPIDFDHSDLTLDALLPFARHCLQLHTLGLFINATIDNDQHNSKPGTKYPVFHRLRCLKMGLSIINGSQQVARFLSRICPIGCVLDTNDKWDGHSGHDVVDARIRWSMWVEVMNLLPLLTQVRIEERAAAAAN